MPLSRREVLWYNSRERLLYLDFNLYTTTALRAAIAACIYGILNKNWKLGKNSAAEECRREQAEYPGML